MYSHRNFFELPNVRKNFVALVGLKSQKNGKAMLFFRAVLPGEDRKRKQDLEQGLRYYTQNQLDSILYTKSFSKQTCILRERCRNRAE